MNRVMRIMLPTAIVGAAFAPALFAQTPAADEGQALFNQHCSACHTLDNATTKHVGETEWRDIVARMVANGAEITPADQAVIVAYLTRHHGPAAAPGKAQ